VSSPRVGCSILITSALDSVSWLLLSPQSSTVPPTPDRPVFACSTAGTQISSKHSSLNSWSYIPLTPARTLVMSSTRYPAKGRCSEAFDGDAAEASVRRHTALPCPCLTAELDNRQLARTTALACILTRLAKSQCQSQVTLRPRSSRASSPAVCAFSTSWQAAFERVSGEARKYCRRVSRLFNHLFGVVWE
jgi:hypothetical protein